MAEFFDGAFGWLLRFFEWRDMWKIILAGLVFLKFWVPFARANWRARDKWGIAVSALLLIGCVIGMRYLYDWLMNRTPDEVAADKARRDPEGDRVVGIAAITFLWCVYAYHFIRYAYFAIRRRMSRDYRRLLTLVFIGTPVYALATWFTLRLMSGQP